MIALVWAIVIVAGLVALSVVLRGSRTHQPQALPPQAPPAAALESPREILDRRFAAGEIDIDEYAEKRAAIEEPQLPKRPGRRDLDEDDD